MAPKTAARLAKRLLQLYGDGGEFHFEVDTEANAELLANKLQRLGCEVLTADCGFRLSVIPRTDGRL